MAHPESASQNSPVRQIGRKADLDAAVLRRRSAGPSARDGASQSLRTLASASERRVRHRTPQFDKSAGKPIWTPPYCGGGPQDRAPGMARVNLSGHSRQRVSGECVTELPSSTNRQESRFGRRRIAAAVRRTERQGWRESISPDTRVSDQARIPKAHPLLEPTDACVHRLRAVPAARHACRSGWC